MNCKICGTKLSEEYTFADGLKNNICNMCSIKKAQDKINSFKPNSYQVRYQDAMGEIKKLKSELEVLQGFRDLIMRHNEYLHCPKCKKDFKKVSEYSWQQDCDCFDKKLILSKG
jgi:protein-arginine kinase activator protein McsA